MHSRHLPLIALFAAIAALYLGWSWSSVLGGFGGDNAHYLFMARHYSPYAAASPVAEAFAAHSIYPPLFPLLLALTGGGESLLAAHLATTACLVGAFGVFFWWTRLAGASRGYAALALLVLALLPGLYLQTLSVHSENLYMLCSLAALACASRMEGAAQPARWLALAVTATAAAYLTRGAGLALVAAWLAWLWLNPRQPGRLAWSLLGLLPVVLWSQFGSAASTDYWSQLVHGYRDPHALLEQVLLQCRHLLGGWAANFGTSRVALAAALLLLALGLSAAAWRTWLRRMDGFYVWAYLGMVVLWPFPAEAQRLILVLAPVLLWQALWGLLRLQQAAHALKPLLAGSMAAFLLASIPEFALTVQRFATPLPPDVPDAYRHTANWYGADLESAAASVRFIATLEADMQRLGERVPEGECIFSIKPSVVAYLSGRTSKAPPGVRSEQSAFEQALAADGCRYFYLLGFASPSYPVPLYPYDRLQDRLEILGGALLPAPDGGQHVLGLLAQLR